MTAEFRAFYTFCAQNHVGRGRGSIKSAWRAKSVQCVGPEDIFQIFGTRLSVERRLYDQAPNSFCKSTFPAIQPHSQLQITLHMISPPLSRKKHESRTWCHRINVRRADRRHFKSHSDHHSERLHMSLSEHLFPLSVMKDKINISLAEQF